MCIPVSPRSLYCALWSPAGCIMSSLLHPCVHPACHHTVHATRCAAQQLPIRHVSPCAHAWSPLCHPCVGRLSKTAAHHSPRVTLSSLRASRLAALIFFSQCLHHVHVQQLLRNAWWHAEIAARIALGCPDLVLPMPAPCAWATHFKKCMVSR